MECTARGLTAAQTAASLCVAFSTVRSHRHSVYRKLGVTDHVQAILTAARAGWIDTDLRTDPTVLARSEYHTLERLLERLIAGSATREGFRKLSTADRAYLEAFDDHIHARDEDQDRTRAVMDVHLPGVLPPGIKRDRVDRAHDLVDLLLKAALEARRVD